MQRKIKSVVFGSQEVVEEKTLQFYGRHDKAGSGNSTQ